MKKVPFNPMRTRQQFSKMRQPMSAEMAKPARSTTAKNTSNNEEELTMEKTAVKAAEIEKAANPNPAENMDTSPTEKTDVTNPTSEVKQMKSNQSQNSDPLPEVKISSLRHISSSKKINLLRKALIAGISREEICFQGEISGAVFDRLYFNLCQLDNKFYKVRHKSHFMNGKVQEKGFYTSMDKIGAIGLGEIFHEGAEIRYYKTEDNKMMIEVIEKAQLPGNFDSLEDGEDTEAVEAQEEIDMGVEEMDYDEEEAEAEEAEAVESEFSLDEVGA